MLADSGSLLQRAIKERNRKFVWKNVSIYSLVVHCNEVDADPRI